MLDVMFTIVGRGGPARFSSYAQQPLLHAPLRASMPIARHGGALPAQDSIAGDRMGAVSSNTARVTTIGIGAQTKASPKSGPLNRCNRCSDLSHGNRAPWLP